MEEKSLKDNLEFFKEKRSELVDKYTDGFVIIYNCEVVDVFKNRLDALKVAINKFGDAKSFLVKNIQDNENNILNFSRGNLFLNAISK